MDKSELDELSNLEKDALSDQRLKNPEWGDKTKWPIEPDADDIDKE